MIHWNWKLSEPGEDNLGLAVAPEGLLLGRTPLLERRDASFIVRERHEIKRLLTSAHGMEPAIDRLMSGLATVASALNAKDPCLAHIAAVHLRIPDLPNQTARDKMEAEDILIKSVCQTPAWRQHGVRKASPDDPEHPGWPAGTPGGLGGRFRPKDGSQADLSQTIKDRITRRELRLNLTAALHIGVEALANLIPGVDVSADVAMVAEFARTTSEYRQLGIDAAAAFDFAQNAPYGLEDLQVSSDYREFSSYRGFVKDEYREFVKGELRLDLVRKWAGSASDGSQYHHLVTQGGLNADDILPERLQNTDNWPAPGSVDTRLS